VLSSIALTGWVTGGTGKLMWRKAVATAILAFTTALAVNLADPSHIIYTWQWAKHVLFASVTVTIVMELRYWRDWAAKILGSPNGNGEHRQ
jgi:hypothetical protein